MENYTVLFIYLFTVSSFPVSNVAKCLVNVFEYNMCSGSSKVSFLTMF